MGNKAKRFMVTCCMKEAILEDELVVVSPVAEPYTSWQKAACGHRDFCTSCLASWRGRVAHLLHRLEAKLGYFKRVAGSQIMSVRSSRYLSLCKRLARKSKLVQGY